MDYSKEVSFLRLTDGTKAVITTIAKYHLAARCGVQKGRIRKGAGGHQDVVVRIKDDAQPRGREVKLMHLLAHTPYALYNLPDAENGFTLIDGDCRNLLPSNYAVKPEKQAADEPVKAPKQRTPKKRPAEYPSVDRQMHWLSVCRLQIRNAVFSILREPVLSEEIVGEAMLEIVEGMTMKQCNFEYPGFKGFKVWAKGVARNRAMKRLQALLCGVIGNTERDRAELKLLKTMPLNGNGIRFTAPHPAHD